MADFNFQVESTVKELEIKNSSGEVVLSFKIDIGEREQTKAWIKEINELQKVGQKFSEDEKAIDEMFEMETKVLNAILGEGSAEKLFEQFNNNVFVALKFVKNLSKQLNAWLDDFYKDYV